MDLNSQYVLREAGCLDRGCTITLGDDPYPGGMWFRHTDSSGAVSRVTLAKHAVFAVMRNPATGNLLNTWVPEFIRWAHDFHEVADRMAERVS